jgi:transketolase
VTERFQGYGWHVQSIADGNDTEAIAASIEIARKETGRPSLIKVRTHIGFGSPNKVDTAAAHGSPLGKDEVRLVKENFGFDPDQSFVVADDVLNYYREKGKQGIKKENDWNDLYENYKEKFPAEAAEYELIKSGNLPEGWKDNLPVFKPDAKGIATRKASGKMLNAIADKLPMLIGGSADLSPSTDTTLNNYQSFTNENHSGRNFHFGIREHSMGAVLNGMALTKGFIPYGATFLIFSDYMRPPIRLAAIMKIRPIIVYTHDSIGLGEDGTTHQPVEQLIGLRSVPNLMVLRPADANETVQAWRVAIEHTSGPVAIILTRQELPIIDQEKFTKASELEKGAYVLSDSEKDPQIILMGSGSEVHLLLEAQEKLKEESIPVRVVSFPSWELFKAQSDDYKQKVFPKSIRKRLAVEAGSPIGWCKYVTDEGDIIAVTKFGESAPGDEIMKEYGFSLENVIERAKALLK